MPDMMAEELQLLNKINQKLETMGMRSRLEYLYVSGIREGAVTEWGFKEQIKEEAAAANILVSEEVENAVL